MSTPTAQFIARAVEEMTQPDLVTVLCAAIRAIDGEHLTRALAELDHSTLVDLSDFSRSALRTRGVWS